MCRNIAAADHRLQISYVPLAMSASNSPVAMFRCGHHVLQGVVCNGPDLIRVCEAGNQ